MVENRLGDTTRHQTTKWKRIYRKCDLFGYYSQQRGLVKEKDLQNTDYYCDDNKGDLSNREDVKKSTDFSTIVILKS